MWTTPRKQVLVAGVAIGGGSPITLQSMTNTDTRDVAATAAQIRRLAQAGCDIVRVAVPDQQAAAALAPLKRQSPLPLVADIHFDYRLALASIQHGADKLRLNPGNIGGPANIRAVADHAREKNIPIRIGVNAGSLEADLLRKYGGVTAEALVESALRGAELLEDAQYGNLVLSIKASDVSLTLAAYTLLARQTAYPLHIGVTEAGLPYAGAIRSAVGIGALLAQGIGDTLRVSLTGDPVEEVRCGLEILKALGLRRAGVEFVSCPTCGRTEIDLITLANKVYGYCQTLDKPIKVAVMGCGVNGPGEARDADIGVAGGRGVGLLFKKGKVVRQIPEASLAEELILELERL